MTSHLISCFFFPPFSVSCVPFMADFGDWPGLPPLKFYTPSSLKVLMKTRQNSNFLITSQIKG